jgi:hypothetical protein
LTLTDEQEVESAHIGYTFAWDSRLSDASGSISLPLILSTGLDSISTLNDLVTNASKGLYVYCIVQSQTGANGQTVVIYGSPDGANGPSPSQGWLNKLSKGPWYINVTGNGSIAKTGESTNTTDVKSASLSAETGYFTDKYKVDTSGSLSYQSEAVPSGTGTQLSAHDLSLNATGLVVYSVGKDWSVAVINNYERNPGSNINFDENVQSGIEWSLVPFRTTQNRELAFRVGPQFTGLTLGQANDLNHLQEKYMGAFAQIYFYWVAMGDKLTMSLTNTTTEDFQHTNYYNTTLTGNIGYQINSVIGINGSSTYAYEPRSITYPANPSYTNPLQTLFLSGQAGGSYGYSVGLTIKLGNSPRKIHDRRWATN